MFVDVGTYRQAIARAKREYLMAVMRECDFIVARAAVMAGCNRTHFYKQLDQYAHCLPRRPTPQCEHRDRNAYGDRMARSGNHAWKALDEART